MVMAMDVTEAHMSWLVKLKYIQTWIDEIFLCPVRNQSSQSTWNRVRDSFDFRKFIFEEAFG